MNDQPNTMASPTTDLAPTDRARDGNGRFTRDPETAKRDGVIARLRSRGMSYRAIARELDIDPTTAHEAVKRALRDTLEEPAAEVRTLELERLDDMWERVMGVLEHKHVTVSNGRIVRRQVGEEVGEDGRPVPVFEEVLDDGPILQAVDRLLKIQERRAKLLGLDAAVKADTGVTISYEIVGIDVGAL